MRILVTGRGLDQNGSRELGIFELDQARALRAAGHDVRFAAVDTRSVRRRRPWGLRTFELDGMPVYYCAIPVGRHPSSLAYAAQQLAAKRLWERVLADGWQPELIHSHFGTGFFPLAHKLGVPTIYTEHDSRSATPEPDQGELDRENEAYRFADRLLCVSAPQAEQIRRNTGRSVQAIHNVVDLESFALPGAPRKREGSFRFAATGNLIPRKGYDLLLSALAELSARGIDACLTVIGDGPERASLEAMAETLGLGDRVEFLGRLERKDIARQYERCDAFVLPSRMETFGVVYIEAMAAGLPVIATVCGGPEDFVNETNGILIPAEDVTALTDAMERMVRTRENYDSAAIAAYARENFSPETVARQLTAVYEELKYHE